MIKKLTLITILLLEISLFRKNRNLLKNIYFTKGTINKNSMIIEAGGNEFFNFKLDEATLNKILEFKNITINGI